MTKHSTVHWFSDSPVGSGSDKLDRRGFLDRIASVLDTLNATNNSTVTGLIGPWGSGKTSLLNQLAAGLETTQEGSTQWAVVRFNPWHYQDLMSLQLGFFNELRSELPKEATWDDVREKVSALAKSVAPLGGLLALFGADLTTFLDKGADVLGPDHSAERQQERLTKALVKTGKPILVVIDDVDRLDPPELLLLLKLIRLTGRLPGVHYLIAYDEETLLDVLSRTGLVGNSPRRAVDYMEKMIQVRLDLPPVRPTTMQSWLNESIGLLTKKYSIEFGEIGRAHV